MRKVVFVLAALVLALGVFAFPSVRSVNAQEGTPSTVCDSTVMLLLYIAQHDYGFQSTTMDVNMFDRGQFGPWFDSMMMMEGDMSGDMAATAEAGDTGSTDAGTGVATAEAGDTGSTDATTPMTTLIPGVVAGEAVECTALRAELENFFYNEINNMMGTAEG